MNLLSRITQGVFWSVLGTGSARLFSLAATTVTARLLGKDAFGALGMVQNTLGFLGVFAGFGLGLTATRYVAELKGRDPRRCGRLIALFHLSALLCGGTMTLLLILAAPGLARHALNAPHLGFTLQLGAPLLVISALLGVQTGSLSGFQALRAIARINIWQGALALPLTLILVYFAGLNGGALSLVFAALIGVALSFPALIKEFQAFDVKADYRRCWTEYRALWRFSLPAVVAASMHSPLIWAAQTILVRQPGGYAEMGLFHAAAKLQVLIMFVSPAVYLVSGPLLAEIYGSRDRRHFARAVNVNLKATWALALPVGFLLIGASPWLLGLFGPAFREGRAISAMLIAVAVLNLANDALGQTMVSSGRMWAGCTLYLTWGLALVTAAWAFIPAMGAAGLALAYFLAYACQTFCALVYAGSRWGWESIAASPGLASLTGLMFLLSSGSGSLPEGGLLCLSVILALVCLGWCWRLIPGEGRRQLLAAAGLKG